MSKPNFEGNSDQTSGQVGSYPNHQSQKQSEEVNSANNVESLGNESASEHLGDELALPFQPSSKPTPSDLPGQNLQGENETAGSSEQQSIEVDLDQKISSTSGDLVNQSSLLHDEALEQESEIREQLRSGETHAQGDNPFPESTVQGRQQSDEEFLAEQSSQLNNNVLKKPSQPEPRPGSIPSPQLPNFTISEETTARQSVHSPTPSTKWAPLIYGRTYEIDFRFLVVPPDFDEHIRNQVWEFIKITTRSPENLPGKPRWIFLRTEHHCIIGTTCLVRDLLNSREADAPEDLTRDRYGRPLYAFVGLVADTPVPSTIPAMDLDVFADPYRKLIPRIWRERYGKESRHGVPQALSVNYCKEFKPEEQVTFNHNHSEISFAQLVPEKQNSILFWNIEDAQNILNSAFCSGETIYIFIGNLTTRELLDSQFMSAALEETSSCQEVERQQQIPSAQPQNTGENSLYPRKLGQASRRSQRVNQSHQESEFDTSPHYEIQETGEQEYSIIEKFLNLPMDAIRLLHGGFEYVLDQITGMEEAELLSYEEQLIAALNASADDLKLLVAQCNDLIRQKRYKEAEEKERELQKRQEKINSTKKILRQIQTRIANTGRAYSSRSGQSEVQHPQDPYFGFKEKDKSGDEPLSEPEQNVSKPSDPWQL